MDGSGLDQKSGSLIDRINTHRNMPRLRPSRSRRNRMVTGRVQIPEFAPSPVQPLPPPGSPVPLPGPREGAGASRQPTGDAPVEKPPPPIRGVPFMPGDPSSDVRGVPFADIPEVPGDQPQLQAARDVVLPQGDIEPMPVGMAPEDQWQFALQSPLQQSLGTDRILIPLGDVWGNVSPQNGYDFGQPTSYSPSHFGVDLRATEGTPVRAPRAARVVAIQTAGSGSYPVGAEGFGTAVRMEDDRGRVFIFAHLSSIDPSIVPGAVVQAGQYFAAAGWTGNVYPSDANGSHLHFEVQDESGNQINPHDILVKNDQGGGGAGGGMLSRILTLKPLSHREQSGLRSTDLVGRG